MSDISQPSAGSFGSVVTGVLQMVGGGLEIALGAGGVAAPTGVTQVGGVILIAHGADTVVAGFRSITSGEVKSSFTQQGTEAVARGFGAGDDTARYIGVGADLAAGVGPSIAMGVARRIAIAGAGHASERVAVAYMHRSALEMGHNAIGIRQGGTTAWFHFAGRPLGGVRYMSGAPGAKYVVTELAVTPGQATGADAARRMLMEAGTQSWGHLGPNCTTTARRVLQQAGIVVPAWSRTPMLLHLGLKAGAEISIVGGSVAAGAAAGGKAPKRASPGSSTNGFDGGSLAVPRS
ncbi:DUF4225 domain-containing protein [Plastoroseomonas hellenica]|uniref:DUF4225 domain-containing protein n=1 Tax=Plastoroseomonas hellenica TaxID=2687306 RepID=UPI001BAC14E1|nr:DUF4225 domain-containing protein [Plastoroseomonas hellenica]MBR0641345.1 DUF4225 domain-containing protein [Plastoroseomonas hellenica]